MNHCVALFYFTGCGYYFITVYKSHRTREMLLRNMMSHHVAKQHFTHPLTDG